MKTLLILCGLVVTATASGWTKWYDYNIDTWIIRELIEPTPCDTETPTYVQVQQKIGDNWELVLQVADMIHLGPRFGLRCLNIQNFGTSTDTKCTDYRLRYYKLTGSPATMTASPWMNRDDPTLFRDEERSKFETPENKQWAADSSYVEFSTVIPSEVKSNGMKLDRKIHVGADYGLLCSDAENQELGLGNCRPYQARFYCP